jgi:hypothetical protein
MDELKSNITICLKSLPKMTNDYDRLSPQSIHNIWSFINYANIIVTNYIITYCHSYQDSVDISLLQIIKPSLLEITNNIDIESNKLDRLFGQMRIIKKEDGFGGDNMENIHCKNHIIKCFYNLLNITSGNLKQIYNRCEEYCPTILIASE